MSKNDDREAEATAWTRLEKTLLKHLDVEEMFVFPALAQSHAAEVDALLREHAVLRREIGVMGLSLDLHTARAEAIETFCETLRKHAEREESLAYGQAEQRLPLNVARAVVARIARMATPRKRTARPRGTAAGFAS